jgi:hypothetical protein
MMCEPVSWVAIEGWRKLSSLERCGVSQQPETMMKLREELMIRVCWRQTKTNNHKQIWAKIEFLVRS